MSDTGQKRPDQYDYEDDSQLGTGVFNSSTFGNETPSDEITKEKEKELEAIEDAMQSANKQVKWIDEELAKVIDIRDFVDQLGSLPSDLPEEQLRNKLELRFLAYNQLVAQKSDIIASAELIGDDVKERDVRITGPFNKPIRLRVVVTKTETVTEIVTEPRPYGVKAIIRGVTDILKGKFM